ncbi:MAG: oligoendopeptidase F family protein, partial [candidate division Zixibacteria bacterium]|nr:oligoendopeptidase F family protein [candidate division Zixibacteria bacterium]
MNSNKLSNAFLMFALAALLIMTAGSTVLAEVKEAPTRDQIEEKYKWDLTALYPNDEAWEKNYTEIEEAASRFEQYQGKLSSSADLMAECLELSDSLGNFVQQLWVYSGLKSDEDTRVGEYQEMYQRVGSLRSLFSQSTSFIEPEILGMENDKL